MSKSKRLGLLVTPKEKDAIVQLAELRGGLSQAALIRCLIREEAKLRGIWPMHASVDAAPQGVSHERA
jgi:hypothetical protein